MIDKPNILIIDDSRIVHSLVKSGFGAIDASFHSAFDGPEGVTIAASLNPDLILLDVEMPLLSGFEVCQRLKTDPRLVNVPVIFLTANSSTAEKIRGLEVGAVDYVTKPFDAAELQARVRSALKIKELLEMLATKAMLDGLTGLWNRGFLDQRLQEEIAFAQRHGISLSCVMLDIDHFKFINDTHGHHFGDQVLRGVARILRQAARAEDIVCRYGGEEFAIVSRGTCGAAAAIFANRMRQALFRTEFTGSGTIIQVTCSAGVAELATAGANLMEAADKALYASKTNGRNRVTLFDPKRVAA